MTLIENAPTPTVDDSPQPQLLFAEAKERRRRRWAIGGILTAVVVLLVVLVSLGMRWSGSEGPSLEHALPLSTPAAHRSGTVTGTLMIEAGVAAAGFHSLPGTVRFVGTQGMGSTVHVADNGKFQVQLRAGTYKAIGSSPKFLDGPPNLMPCNGRLPVVVRPGRTSKVVVVCEGM